MVILRVISPKVISSSESFQEIAVSNLANCPKNMIRWSDIFGEMTHLPAPCGSIPTSERTSHSKPTCLKGGRFSRVGDPFFFSPASCCCRCCKQVGRIMTTTGVTAMTTKPLPLSFTDPEWRVTFTFVKCGFVAGTPCLRHVTSGRGLLLGCCRSGGGNGKWD